MGLRAGLDCRLMTWYGIVTTYLLWLSFCVVVDELCSVGCGRFF